MSNYPLLDVFWTMFLFFCWTLWIFLVVWVLIDIFRSHDISGWGKAGWTLLVILLPLIGVLVYEIVHADHMARGSDLYARDSQSYDETYPSGGTGSASELSKLSDLHDRGAISDVEFERGKEKILR